MVPYFGGAAVGERGLCVACCTRVDRAQRHAHQFLFLFARTMTGLSSVASLTRKFTEHDAFVDVGWMKYRFESKIIQPVMRRDVHSVVFRIRLPHTFLSSTPLP